MEAVGVVLVSALLVIPASSASLLTDRFSKLILLSAVFGVIAALSGSFFSFVFDDLAAGPMVVLSSSVIFALSFCFSPKNGLFMRWLRNRRRHTVVAMENQLKAIYRFQEDRSAEVSAPFSAIEIPALKGPWILRRLLGNEMITAVDSAGQFVLTAKGKNTAQRLVRHHRLWELYLANRAKYALDHVHDDAEKMEHLMTDEQAKRLAEILGNPTTDPHGRVIP
jgi:manganese/zinc/iron transport system permease protein